MKHLFSHSGTRAGRCCQLCYSSFCILLSESDSLIFCGGGGLWPLTRILSLSAQISHHRCYWAAEEALCHCSLMWLLHWPRSSGRCLQKSILLRPPQQHENIFEVGDLRKHSQRWLTHQPPVTQLAYVETWSVKWRHNPLAGNNTLMKRFQTGW